MVLDDRLTPLFLLFLSSLLIACPAEDDSGDTMAASTGSANQGSDGPETSTTDDSSPDPQSSGATSSAPMDDTSDGDTTAGIECEEPIPVGEIDPACLAYADRVDECLYDGMAPQQCIDAEAARCQYDADDYGGEYGDGCRMAILEVYACLSMSSCEELAADEWDDQPCPDELLVAEVACGGG